MSIARDLGAERHAQDSFHAVMGHLDGPMFILTAVAPDGEVDGCLVGFAAQCAIDPPRFMVFVSKANHTYEVARRAKVLGVHVPDSSQLELAARFGTRTADRVDKLATEPWRPGPEGVPILEEVERWFVGRVLERTDCGDHVGFLLDPVDASATTKDLGQLGFRAVKDLDAGHDP